MWKIHTINLKSRGIRKSNHETISASYIQNIFVFYCGLLFILFKYFPLVG